MQLIASLQRPLWSDEIMNTKKINTKQVASILNITVTATLERVKILNLNIERRGREGGGPWGYWFDTKEIEQLKNYKYNRPKTNNKIEAVKRKIKQGKENPLSQVEPWREVMDKLIKEVY